MSNRMTYQEQRDDEARLERNGVLLIKVSIVAWVVAVAVVVYSATRGHANAWQVYLGIQSGVIAFLAIVGAVTGLVMRFDH
jgi:hypothetical protein